MDNRSNFVAVRRARGRVELLPREHVGDPLPPGSREVWDQELQQIIDDVRSPSWRRRCRYHYDKNRQLGEGRFTSALVVIAEARNL
jgi:hypothetical protein